jgi:hypothetical protein
LNQRRKNLFKHILGPLQHFVIPEPNHSKSTASEILRSLDVVQQIIRVLSAVDFDNEPRSKTDKVDDISADRLLPSESMIAEVPVAQMTPKATFGVRCIQAKSARVFDQ